MAETVRLYEVVLRDGLQNEDAILPARAKIDIAHRLVQAGFKDIEVTSFVRPRWIPQLADAAEVVRGLPDAPDVRFWALVPNQVGLDRALEAGIGHVATFLSASETHNQKNVNRTVRESLEGLRRVVQTAKGEGLTVRSYISTVFGCEYEGPVPVERSLELATQLLDAGADEVALGDTTGMAHPAQVIDVLSRYVDAGIPLSRISLHFHDTRGTALANVWAAWTFGARSFDGSVSGVGGCPYAPGAAGNACTQDMLYMFDQMGVRTGVDLEAACEAGDQLEALLGRPLPGRYHRYWQGARQRARARTA